jgi:hypothetical protein
VLVAAAGHSACGSRTGLQAPERDDGSARPAADAATCVPRSPPVEVCNGLDDNCDGRIDEGLGIGPLGAPSVLRTDEGETGGCISCRWAWRPVLAPLSNGGYLAVWYVGILGGSERPNVFGRVIDAHGAPQAPVGLLGSDVVLSLHALAPAPRANGDTALGTCFRVGNRDVGGWELVHADGTLTAVRGPDSSACHEPFTLLGDRVIAVWAQLGLFGVDVLRLDGSAISTQTQAEPNLATWGAGAFGDHMALWLLVADSQTRGVLFQPLRATGEFDGGLRPLQIPYELYPRLVGLSDGYLLVSPGVRGGNPAGVTRLNNQGDVVRPEVLVADGHRLSDSGTSNVVAHHPTERVLISAWQDVLAGEGTPMHVEVMDEDGAVQASWSGPAPGSRAFVSPSVTFAGARVLLAWHDTAENAMPNRVFVQEFGCAP